ncbi:MAG: hypothetical protein BMS9Abin23_0118 [Thermodesulfobacteriota bacterium]|nr:MAG: hypothetical protein BMS9Abin23_0118 [Thermodesulfobacteriota bacterium]
MTYFKKRFFAVFVCALGLWAFSGPHAFAKDKAGLKWGAEFDVELAYDSNIYKLSGIQKDRLDVNNTSDQISGRFNDMESAGDFVTSPRFKPSLKLSGLGGRTFRITPSVTYNLYARNKEKNFLELGLDLSQDIGSKGKFTVELDYDPDVFRKNYLSDAVDTDGNGSISSSEKIFSAANYDESSIAASYKHRLWKHAKGRRGYLGLDKVYGEVLVGFKKRDYDNPFENRSYDDIFAGTGLDMELGNDSKVSFSYLFADITTDVAGEVLIRNEPDFGVDFNGDGDTLDLDTRTVQNVDRSRNEHTLGVKGRTRIGKRWFAEAGYDVRFQLYKSDQRFDVTRLDRKDVRQRINLGVKGKLAPKWTLGLDWTFSHEKASRDGLASIDQAESKSYNRHVVAAVISYKM